ncbi:type I toxin-antitoxin system Fst family toxin [Streptococcus pneumoniae]
MYEYLLTNFVAPFLVGIILHLVSKWIDKNDK